MKVKKKLPALTFMTTVTSWLFFGIDVRVKYMKHFLAGKFFFLKHCFYFDFVLVFGIYFGKLVTK